MRQREDLINITQKRWKKVFTFFYWQVHVQTNPNESWESRSFLNPWMVPKELQKSSSLHPGCAVTHCAPRRPAGWHSAYKKCFRPLCHQTLNMWNRAYITNGNMTQPTTWQGQSLFSTHSLFFLPTSRHATQSRQAGEWPPHQCPFSKYPHIFSWNGSSSGHTGMIQLVLIIIRVDLFAVCWNDCITHPRRV